MKIYFRTAGCVLIGALLLLSCASIDFGKRTFTGPIMPVGEQQSEQVAVNDDRSVTFALDRLEVTLRPLTIEFLNRQFASFDGDEGEEGFYDNPYEISKNPYTYGDWIPPEQEWPTPRFTIFNLTIKNYEFPKVLVKPENIVLVASNGRKYHALTFPELYEYHLPYSWGNMGNLYLSFEERKDIMARTLFEEETFTFGGQETAGYIVFAPLHKDVEEFEILVNDVAVRFDFRDDPVETMDIAFEFERDVYVAERPKAIESLQK